ncbi:MAG: efflux RND transporter periplasmic adaptor subunit [Desulfomonilaceae bacterium]
MSTSQGSSIITCFIVALVLLSACGQRQQPPAPRVQEVAAITLQPQELELTTEFPGRTSAYLVAEIRPQVSGIIQQILFTKGSRVKARQVLYEIDPAPFQAALDGAKANLEKSEANLVTAQLKFERYKRLNGENSIGQQDYDCEEMRLRQAKADALYCKAAVKIAGINLDHTRITEPITGHIGKSNVTTGAFVAADQNLALATIQRLDLIYVDVPQSTYELQRLKLRLEEGRLNQNGRRSEVRLLLENGTEYPLKGMFQFRDITVDATTGSVILRVVVPNPEGVLLPGMFVRAVVKEGSNEQAILIPQSAVSRDPKGNPYTLVVDTEERVQQQALTVGRSIGSNWVVSSGLRSGDRVIMEEIQKVRPGDSVKVVRFIAVRKSDVEPGSNPKDWQDVRRTTN